MHPQLTAVALHHLLLSGALFIVVVFRLAPQRCADGTELAPLPSRLARSAQRHLSVLRHADAAQHRTGGTAEARGRGARRPREALAGALTAALRTRVSQLAPLRHCIRWNGLAPSMHPDLAFVTLQHGGIIASIAPKLLAYGAVLALLPPAEAGAA